MKRAQQRCEITDEIKGDDAVVISDAIRCVLMSDKQETPGLENIVSHIQMDETDVYLRSKQEEAFAFLKQNYQPDWKPVPPLMWKKELGVAKGTVVRAGKPVYNATVWVEGQKHSQKTDQNGMFAFFDLAPGKYILNIIDSSTNKHEIEVTCGKVLNFNP